jgi:hypothetical protein
MSITEGIEAIKRRWQRFCETASKPARCIFCQGRRLWWNGLRQRTASVWVDGEVIYLPEVTCRRVKCGSPQCQKSWTVRPWGLFPQRHYQLCVVAHGLSGYLFDPFGTLAKTADACCCSERTVRRWVRWTGEVADPVGLARRILQACGEPIVAPIHRLTDLLRKARSGLGQGVRMRAGQLLCLLEALGQARGYEPPGLRGVLEAVVGDRPRLTTYRCPSLPEVAWRQWAAPWAILPT